MRFSWTIDYGTGREREMKPNEKEANNTRMLLSRDQKIKCGKWFRAAWISSTCLIRKRKSSVGLMNRLLEVESMRRCTSSPGYFSIHFIIEYLFCWSVIVLQVVVNSNEMTSRRMPAWKDEKGSLWGCACVRVWTGTEKVTILRHRRMKIDDSSGISTHELKKSFNDTLFMCGWPAWWTLLHTKFK